MKYRGSIVINRPINMVAAYFADPQYLGEYQEGYVKKELQRGKEGTNGAVSKMYYKAGSREMELVETVTSNQLPHSFEAHYHHKHMDNTMKCNFTAIGENQTRYDTAVEYTRISWIMPRLMAILFPGMYKKPGQRWMQNFKEFVEKQPLKK